MLVGGVMWDQLVARPSGWRSPKKGWRYGEGHPKVSVTDEQVEEIRRRHAAGEWASKLAAEYGIAYRTCVDIVRMRTRCVK